LSNFKAYEPKYSFKIPAQTPPRSRDLLEDWSSPRGIFGDNARIA